MHTHTVIENLAQLAAEWREAAAGAPLSNMTANVALLLEDIIDALALTDEERTKILAGRPAS